MSSTVPLFIADAGAGGRLISLAAAPPVAASFRLLRDYAAKVHMVAYTTRLHGDSGVGGGGEGEEGDEQNSFLLGFLHLPLTQRH